MNILSKKKFIFLLLFCLKTVLLFLTKGQKILLYGNSNLLEALLKIDFFNGINIIGIVDKNFQNHKNSKFPIYAPEQIKDLRAKYILLTIYNNNANIYNELKSNIPKTYKLLPNILQYFNEEINSYLLQKCNSYTLIKQDGSKIQNPQIDGLKINFRGTNNNIEIYEPCKFIKSKIIVHNNCKIEIKSDSICQNMSAILTNNSKLFIGEKFDTRKIDISFLFSTNQTITIGDDCLIAKDATIKVSDNHTIFEKDNPQNVLNPNQNISIGNHVWIADNVTILKGSRIPNNTIVGAKSLVNKPFEQEYTLISGSPAKIKKENINWDAKSPDKYMEQFNKFV